MKIASAWTGADLALVRAGKVLVERSSPFELLFLRADCRLETILPAGSQRPAYFFHTSASGDLLYDDGSYGTETRLVKRAGQSPVPLPVPAELAEKTWQPVLSDDGRSLVWEVSRGLGNGEVDQQLKVRNLETGDERSIPLERVRMGFEVLAAAKGEYLLAKYPNQVLAVDDHGKTTWGPVEANAVEHIHHSFLRAGGGWIAWNLTGAALQWALPSGSGKKTFPGSSLESVSATPDGRWIAVSASASSRLVDEESIAILRPSDGKPVFHRPLPKYSRVKLAFLGNTHLAVDTKNGVEVLKLPASLLPVPDEALPKPVDLEAKKTEYIGQLAKMFGLTPEKTGPDTSAALIGQWKPADIGGQPGCGMDSPFLEFRSDGFAYVPESGTKMGAVEIRESEIRIDQSGSGTLSIFPMSGGFYIPSYECGLIRLERIP